MRRSQPKTHPERAGESYLTDEGLVRYDSLEAREWEPCVDCGGGGCASCLGKGGAHVPAVEAREPREWTMEAAKWPFAALVKGKTLERGERVQVVEKDAHRAQVVAEIAEALREKAATEGGDAPRNVVIEGCVRFILRREADR